MAKERILFAITRSDLGGAQKHILWLIENLVDEFDVRVVVGEIGYLTSELEHLGVSYQFIPSLVRQISPIRDIKTIRCIRSEIKSFQPSIIHLHSFKAAMLGRIATIGKSRHVVVTVHGWSFTDGNPRSRQFIGIPVEKLLAPFSDRLVTVSKRDFDTAIRKKIGRTDQLVLIPNGVPDITPSKPGSGKNNKVLSLICVGRLCEQKNQLALVEILDLLPEYCQLILVGDGPHRQQIEQRIDELGLSGRVTIDTDNTHPENLLQNADIYVSLSKWEGLPLSIIEALRAGLPVVATDVGGSSELVVNRKNGCLITRNSKEVVVKALTELVGDSDLREGMGRNSRSLYLREYTLDRFIRKTREMYRAMLNN
ncbi:MAG: glycosyl transferase [marine bacterium B5-7]|nr:MAG: glycosyl transferase [marine bacterium B5-7]